MTTTSPLQPFEHTLRGRRVLVTGHTGFKGSWLVLWLDSIGAEVHGLSLQPATEPNLFTAAQVERSCSSNIGDIRDAALVARIMTSVRPDLVLHLAAQPLVLRSYEDPLETFLTNVTGTANVLDAARKTPSVKAVVCVTSDKVYKDRDWHWGYRETDTLGGKDPYSASKAAAEIVAASFRASYGSRDGGVAIATARGGNIIGGGDWSANRIVPDFARALGNQTSLTLRHPGARRPWQHVLALSHGYLVLAACLIDDPATAADAWNFGPADDDAKTVGELVEALAANWERPQISYGESKLAETRFLRLDSAKARSVLGWSSPIAFDDTVKMTTAWYSGYAAQPHQARKLCAAQIETYRNLLQATA